MQSFGDALSELERMLKAMAEMSKRTDATWKREFIEMRRRLQVQLSLVATTAQECDRIKGDPKALGQLRESMARMRSNLALHQANWPAVAIDPTNFDYTESVRKARETNWAFVELARQIIADVRRGPAPMVAVLDN